MAAFAVLVTAGCPSKPPPNLDLLGKALPPPALPDAPRLATWRFTDPHPVTAVLPERDVVWIGTAWGLVRAAPDGSKTERFGPESGLPHAEVTALARDGGGTLWVGTKKGLAKQLQEQRFEAVPGVVPEEQAVVAMAADREGDLWVGGPFGLLRGKQGSGFVRLHDRIDVSAIVPDPEEGVWLATRTHGVLRARKGSFLRYGKPHGLADESVAGLSLSADGTAIAWSGETVSVYDGTLWFPYRLEQDGARWDLLGGVSDARGHMVLTPFGMHRLRKARIPADPEVAKLVLHLLEQRRPRIAPQDVVVPTQPVAKAVEPEPEEEEPAAGLATLPPMPELTPPADHTAAEQFGSIRAEVVRARAAYQRAAVDYVALKEELSALERRRDEARKRIEAAEQAAAATASADAGAAAAAPAVTEAKEEARAAGVAFQLMVEREQKAAAEVEAARAKAVDLQEQLVALADESAADPTVDLPSDKAVAGAEKLDVGVAREVPEVRVKLEDAPYPTRADAAVPRFALTPANEFADLPPAMITLLLAVGEETWIGTRYSGVLRQTTEERKSFETADVVPRAAVGGPVVDSEGHVWTAARDGSVLYRFDGRDWHREKAGEKGRLVAVAADPGGRIWAIARGEAGLTFLRRGDAGFEPAYERTLGDKTDELAITRFAVSADGTAWLAVSLPGRGGRPRPAGAIVVVADGSAVHHKMDPTNRLFDTGEGRPLPSDRVTGFAFHDQTTFVATFGGICQLGPDVFRVEGENEGLESEVVRDVVVDNDGNPWLATSMGVGLRTERWEAHTASQGLPSKDVRSLAVGPSGLVWALTKAGPAHKRSGKGWEAVRVRGLRRSEGSALIVPAKGRVWVLTEDALLMRAE